MMMIILMRIMATWGKGSFFTVQTLNAKKRQLVGQFTRNFAYAKRFLVATFLSFRQNAIKTFPQRFLLFLADRSI